MLLKLKSSDTKWTKSWGQVTPDDIEAAKKAIETKRKIKSEKES